MKFKILSFWRYIKYIDIDEEMARRKYTTC